MTDESETHVEREYSPGYLFAVPGDVDHALHLLGRAGFDLMKLSLIGPGNGDVRRPPDCDTSPEALGAWQGIGTCWERLRAPVLESVAGFGLVAMAGPIVTTPLRALECAFNGRDTDAVAAALIRCGVPPAQADRYELALRADKYVLLVHGTANEVVSAHRVLGSSKQCEAA